MNNDLEKAEEKYNNDPLFHKVVDSLFSLLRENTLRIHDLELALKLAEDKDNIETMSAYENSPESHRIDQEEFLNE